MIQGRRAWKGLDGLVGDFGGCWAAIREGICGYPVNRWGIKRHPNGTKFDRRPTGDVPRPLGKFRSIPRMLFSSSRNEIWGVQRVHVWMSDSETDNGENDRMHETNTNANEMHMMTWDELPDMNKMQKRGHNPTMDDITYNIVGNGKSWSYNYRMLHPGHYNTPPLQEDLVPRSRMAPEEKQKRKTKVN